MTTERRMIATTSTTTTTTTPTHTCFDDPFPPETPCFLGTDRSERALGP